MLGLPGFRVLAADEVDGELETTVETVAARAGCPDCGVVATPHDRRDVLVRDVDAFGRRARLRWRKPRLRCHEPACPKRTWTERSAEIGARASLSERSRARGARPAAHITLQEPLGTGFSSAMKFIA